MGAAYQKTPEHLVALSRDAFLWIALTRLVFGGCQTQVSAHLPALFEALRILQGEHEGQSRKCPYPPALGARASSPGSALGRASQVHGRSAGCRRSTMLWSRAKALKPFAAPVVSALLPSCENSP